MSTLKFSTCLCQHFEFAWPGMSKVPKIKSLHYLLQYLKKDVRDEVDFLPTDKHQSFLHMGHGQECSKFPK